MVLFIPVYVLLVACLPLSRGHCLPDQPAKGGLQVRYGQTNVQYNSVVAVDRASAVPALHADVGNEAGKVLLIMIDPDAPSAASCPTKYWLHWMAEGHMQNGAVVIDKTLVDYNGPTPPPGSGPHRYQLILYPLGHSIPQDKVPQKRSGFDLQPFTSAFHLAQPLAGFQFTAER